LEIHKITAVHGESLISSAFWNSPCTGAAGAGEAGNGRQQVQKQDGQLARRRILPRSRFWQRMRANLEFAMHKVRTVFWRTTT
jgi:hypothetical protein